MKFSNSEPVASTAQLKQQSTEAMAWQPVALTSQLDGEVEMATDGRRAQVSAPLVLIGKDNAKGSPVTVDNARKDDSVIAFRSQSLGEPTLNSSLALVSDAADEVVSIYLEQAQAYCDENQWEKAVVACQEALKVSPSTAEIYKSLGKILQKQGRPTDAMGFYAKAIALQPNFPEVYSNLGSLYAQKGKWEKAVSYYQKAIERDPQLAVAYLNLAKVWKKLGRQDSELSCRATALRIQPNLGSAKDHFDLAQAMDAAHDLEGAILFYRQAVDQDPKMVAAHQRLADLLEDAGDWQAAAVCYRKVLMLNTAAEKASAAQLPGQLSGQSSDQLSASALPKKLSPENQQKVLQLLAASKTKKVIRNASANSSLPSAATPQQLPPSAEPEILSPTDLAKRYAAAKDWPQAIECVRLAIAQAPQSAILYRSLAKLFEQNNNPQQAAEAWYRSFLLEPSWPDAQQCFSLGQVLTQYGNTAAAALCYRQSIQLQPEFLAAHKALKALSQSAESQSAESQSAESQSAESQSVGNTSLLPQNRAGAFAGAVSSQGVAAKK